jgi:membrane protease YdiL (CAAX protease family)
MEAAAVIPGVAGPTGLNKKRIIAIGSVVLLIVLIAWWWTERQKKLKAMTDVEKAAAKATLQKTAIVVGSATIIGFLGDVVMYSVGASQGTGKFKIAVPKGMALVQVLIIGVITGFIIDAVMRYILESQKVDAEKNLDKLVENEVNKIKAGQIPDKAVAEKVEWKA